ncbi:MAG: hypothetical protein EOO88_26515 [Pedobacter sp.]|nr:MAG: hypothetical protein EOO88_26515 [Pedobacter sp.]
MNEVRPMETPQRPLLTIKQFSERHPFLTPSAIRNLIAKSKDETTTSGKVTFKGNGFGIAVFRMGRKVLIDEALFFAWLDSRNGRS